MKIFILHPGKANYPEIAAYTAFLVRHGFEVFDGDSGVYARFPFKDECVLWCIMGFYRAHDGARFVIHDYRSLSLGRLAWMKDGIKRAFNARPHLRVFQNERMRDAMGFLDRVPQADALRIVRRSEYAVCYFPYHRPHCFQTPTKLLEYAALGKKIICNDAPSNVLACAELDIRSLVTGPSIFDGLPPASRIAVEDNDPRSLRGLEWTSVIERSGVLAHLEAALPAQRW